MKIAILTLFPQAFESVFASSIMARAMKKKLVNLTFINIRDFAADKHKSVDDTPYGGGRGMILKVDVVARALDSIKPKPYTILLSASGRKYDQKMASNLSKKESIAIICGHYEGTDARVEEFVDDVVAIGDFVLTGGEIAAMVMVDSTSRLIPGVINKESLKSESFSLPTTLLEYPQYTRPEVFKKTKVPKVLLSGDHKKIAAWRRKEAISRTKKYRPDLLKNTKH